jgi:pimeloyl-ACP methyl ester carboxylesterase
MFILKIILAVILLAILFAFIYHRVCLWNEKKKFPPTGKMVEINGHKMHIYAEGKGADTLVFLSGGGTACPSLDFKALYSKFSQDYHIVVVERAGYGFSESVKVSRDVDTILEETRSALQSVGDAGPYVIFPQSISGLEAIHWAQKYPYEVKAIIGLDAAVPAHYLKTGEKRIRNYILMKEIGGLFFQSGIPRFVPSFYEKNLAMRGDALANDEKAMDRAFYFRNFLTLNNVDEMKACYANAKKVDALGMPVNTPMYFFISDGKEVGIDGWQNMEIDTIKQIKRRKYQVLNCGHYVHDHEPDLIAQESKKFIAEIES